MIGKSSGKITDISRLIRKKNTPSASISVKIPASTSTPNHAVALRARWLVTLPARNAIIPGYSGSKHTFVKIDAAPKPKPDKNLMSTRLQPSPVTESRCQALHEPPCINLRVYLRDL